jgi:Methionine biosynthesis protein MetW
MNSKICLIPRGTSHETYRFFEAIRFGCIPITEALPSHWFYNNSPTIKIKNWHNLSQELEKLLTDSSLIQTKHQEALWWWQNKCSEIAVANYIVNKLESAITS